MSIVLISFLLLGTMLLFFISQYWQNDKNELLRRNAESISALTQKSLVEDADTGTYYISNRYVLQGFLSTFSDSSNADIFITDVQGKTLLCSEGGNCIHTQQSIPDKIMKDVLNNGFVSTSNLGGIYPYSHFTVGVPVTSESGVQVGAVFTSTDALYLTSFRNDVLKMFLFAAIAALFVLRLAYLQVIAAPAMASEAENARMSYDWIEPRRGTIYDRNGVVLATSVESTTIYIDPVEVDDADATAQVLVDVLGGQKSDYLEAITAPNTRYAVVKEKADVAVGDALKERVRELSASGGSREGMDFGIRYKTLWKREYPNAQVGGQVIGVCTLETDAENNREYYKGVSGLELYYDDVLSGEAGYTREERSPDGTPIPGGTRDSKAAVDGEDIIISIDIELQQSVEERLTADAKGITANGGSAIVMDGGTGEIYAAASLPLLNPADRTNMEADAPKLKCVTDLFEPGSIFKSVSAMAILEAGTMTPDTELFCPSSIEADGYVITDAHERGDATYTLQQIMDQSSNVGISLATENATANGVSGFENLYNKINEYNLHTKTGVDYPGEGEAGTDYLGALLPFDEWSKVTGYNVSFGQGLSLTPLQITRFYGALVNDGVECTPHFLLSKPQSGETAEYGSDAVIKDKKAIDDLTSMLKTVVTEGTGKAAAIDGFNVAGKTSTAEIYDEKNGGYRKGVYNLAFTGFLADSSSQLVCFVGANEVPTDGVVTPIFKDIMTTAIDRFNIYPE